MAAAMLFRCVLVLISVAAQAAMAQVPASMDTGMYEPPVTVIFYQPIPGSIIDHGKAIIEISIQGLEDRRVEILWNGILIHR
jgi:hypothetical protein